MSIEPLTALLLVCLFLCVLLIYSGLMVFIIGVRQISVPEEARKDPKHPKHKIAKKLYFYKSDGRLAGRKPGRVMFSGLFFIILFSFFSFLIINKLWL